MTLRSIHHLLVVSLLWSVVSTTLLIPKMAQAGNDDFPSISVSGRAVERVVPDKATFSFAIQTRGRELAGAVDVNDAKIKAVIEFLQESGIEGRFIRTDVLRIDPLFPPRQTPYKAQVQQVEPNDEDPFQKVVPIGYLVQRGISITLHDLKAFDKIYRGLIERGVNSVEGLSFETSDLVKYRQQARIKAIRAAREKAETLAHELGATLAAVQSISEAAGHVALIGNAFNRVSVVSDQSGTVGAGEIEISITVNLVFRLGDTAMEPADDETGKSD